jgi:hypothetical protein
MLDEGCSTVYCEASAALGSYLSDGLEPQGRKLASELGNAATFVRQALPRLSGSGRGFHPDSALTDWNNDEIGESLRI